MILLKKLFMSRKALRFKYNLELYICIKKNVITSSKLNFSYVTVEYNSG